MLKPLPLINSLEDLDNHYLSAAITGEFVNSDYEAVRDFLLQYKGNQSTFESYRREIERLVQWAWLIAKQSILTLKRIQIEEYIEFCLNPPKQWIGVKNVPRFIDTPDGKMPNPQWYPFVVKVNKYAHKSGIKPEKSTYQMTQSSIRALFAILGSFYDYLLLEEKIPHNPIALIRQKSRYVQKNQHQMQVIRLSDIQWRYLIETAELMANEQSEIHERTLFIVTAMYQMYLRISEFIATERWIPQMGHFFQDSNSQWWFKTVGKGNKLRNIAVSSDMLKALIRYRESLKLTALPSPNEKLPLISKHKGKGPIESTRHIRRILQICFDKAIVKLHKDHLSHEAQALEIATVHWLRHTGISDDINKRGRPMLHVRDDAGHASIATTEHYSDVELAQRYKTAKGKKTKSEARLE